MFPLPWNKAYRKKDGSLTTVDEAISSGGTPYELPTASSSTKGGVKIGSGLTMTGEVLSNDNPTPYSLPTASAETLGGIKVGSGLTITDGVLSASGGGGGSVEYRAGVQAANIGAGSWNSFSINFSSAMPDTNYALLLYSTDSNDKMIISGLTKTVNGVTGRVDNPDSAAHIFLINYIAIGYN